MKTTVTEPASPAGLLRGMAYALVPSLLFWAAVVLVVVWR